MRTLEELKARCTVTEGGCWEFPDARTSSVWAFDHRHGAMRSMRPSRAAWTMKHGREAPKGYRYYTFCGNDECCAPDHVKAMPMTAFGAMVRRTGKWKGQTRRVLASRATGRKRSKLTPEVLHTLHTSTKPGYVLARELGMSPTTVSKGRRMLGVTVPASPWTGMGAR